MKAEWSGINGFVARREGSTKIRKHLLDWMQEEPEARHLIVAHSHGGTVVASAVGDADDGQFKDLAGILTLATPFVSIRDPFGSTQDSSDKPPSAVIRRMVMMLFWPLFAVIPLVVVSSLLFVDEVHTSNIVMWCIAGGILVFQLVEGLGLLPWFAKRSLRFDDLVSWSTRVPNIPCEIVAIRTPGDEAQLAIGTAQAVGWVFDRLWGLVDVPLGWLFSRFKANPRLTSGLVLLAFIAASLAYNWIDDGMLQDPGLDFLRGLILV